MTDYLELKSKPLLGPGYTVRLCDLCAGTGRIAQSTLPMSGWPICWKCQAEGWLKRRTPALVKAEELMSSLTMKLVSCPLNDFKHVQAELYYARVEVARLCTYVADTRQKGLDKCADCGHLEREHAMYDPVTACYHHEEPRTAQNRCACRHFRV